MINQWTLWPGFHRGIDQKINEVNSLHSTRKTNVSASGFFSRFPPDRSHRLQQDVLLLAERQLDDAVVRQIVRAKHALVVLLALVVDFHRAALDVPAHLAVGAAQTSRDKGGQDADTRFEVTSGNLDGRQALGGLAFFKCLACGFW